MMIETATVIAYHNGIATVQCQAKQGCGGCSAQASCGTKALSALAGEKTAPQFELAVNQPLAMGDQIELGLPEQTLLTGVFWLYGVPLIALLGSAVGFSLLTENELIIALGILFCTGGSFVAVRKLIERQLATLQPQFLRRVSGKI